MMLAAALFTQHGSWNAFPWFLLFLCLVGITLWIRHWGRKDCRTSGDAQKPFISGNKLDDPEDARIPASNLYWGFTEALKRYYNLIRPLHSGVLTDYFFWFLAVLALLWVLKVGL